MRCSWAHVLCQIPDYLDKLSVWSCDEGKGFVQELISET